MSSHLLTGRSITRVEDERLLRGRGRYVDDVRVPGTPTQVHAGGTWIESTSRSTIRVINPATEKQIAAVTEGSAEDAERAVAAVQEAFPTWSLTPPAERGKYVARIGDVLRSRVDELTATISAELGVPRHLAAGFQVRYPLSKFAAYEELAEAFPWQERSGGSTLLRAPVGVVAAITPWNFPIGQAVDKIAAAMLAGCIAILKPSELQRRPRLRRGRGGSRRPSRGVQPGQRRWDYGRRCARAPSRR